MAKTPIQKAKDALSGKSTAARLKAIESRNKTKPKPATPKGPKKKAYKPPAKAVAARKAAIEKQQAADRRAIAARKKK
jgi:hypothetical protein